MPQAAPNNEKLDEHLQEVVRALHGAVKTGRIARERLERRRSRDRGL